jgi:RNA 2',3'-cyclic 3'-phosphodiesterase
VAGAETYRLFVAVYPPAEFVNGAMSRLAQLALPEHRPTPPEQVHMTLQFVGDAPARELPTIRESVDRAAAGITAFELAPIRFITLPERGPARLMAVETDAPPSLTELQRRLAIRLARNARDRADGRFLPHLTLARFPGGGIQGVGVSEAAAFAGFRVDSVRLMCSVLSPRGAWHRELACLPLNFEP